MATTQSTTTQTGRSAGAKKAAATRSANARKRSAAAKKAAATRADNARTPVDYATEYAEKAVLIPLGASLVARDRVIETVSDLSDLYTDRAKAEKELRKFERRGRTARNRFEREVRKNRTKVERTLRTRRNRVEREIKAFRRDLDKQATSTRKNVVTQAEVAQTRVEALVKDLQAEFTKRVQSVA